MASPVIDAALSRLTLEEKISLLAGGEVWSTVPIPEKGIPCVKTTDGPNGARGVNIKDGVTAACFPAECSIASTFDVDLARRVGVALGEEALTKGARCLLAPTVCIQRHPLGGRNFETFSEDPFLSGQMGVASVDGIQSTGVAATVKHYAANEQETQRLRVNAVVSERALREIYLKPFELIAKNAKPWAFMTAYNKINGHHADENEFLLKRVLRGDWKWNGLVMSDWGGTNSTAAALNAGVDLEMPGPTRWRKTADVLASIAEGHLTEATIHERALQVLTFVARLDGFTNPTYSDPGEQSIDRPEHAALIREAGAKGIVLLKNRDQTLPLTREKLRGKKVALLGYAMDCLAHGGGSASVKPHYKVTPWDAFHEAFEGDDVKFSFSRGAHTFRQLPLLINNVHDLDGNPGFTLHIKKPGTLTPDVTVKGYSKSEISLLDGHVVENVEVDLVGILRPEETCTYYVTLGSLGPSKLVIEGETILEQHDNCPDPMGFLFGGVPVPRASVRLEKGKKYSVQISAVPPVPVEGRDIGFLEGQVGVRVGWMASTEHDVDILSEAVELARASDYSVIFTGNDPSWETEGQDQAGFHLPRDGSQDALVAAVAAVCPKTIVVNSTGCAVAFPWLDQVDALLQTWFPGQEAGHSIVDVLTGAQNPEGHLTCTFPKRLEDCPAYGNFPGKAHPTHGLEVEYAEGVFVGYRHFDRLPPSKVNFPFGFGLSYTSFEVTGVTARDEGNDTYVVEANVTNSGTVKGAIALQVYIGQQEPIPENPIKTLVAFKKVTLEPGTSMTVELHVQGRELASWHEGAQEWVMESGDYVFNIGKSSGEMVGASVLSLDRRSYAP